MTAVTEDDHKTPWRVRIGSWLYARRLGSTKLSVATFVVLGVFNLILSGVTLVQGGFPYFSGVASVLAVWWAWDSYDDYKLLREIEALKREGELLDKLIEHLKVGAQA